MLLAASGNSLKASWQLTKYPPNRAQNYERKQEQRKRTLKPNNPWKLNLGRENRYRRRQNDDPGRDIENGTWKLFSETRNQPQIRQIGTLKNDNTLTANLTLPYIGNSKYHTIGQFPSVSAAWSHFLLVPNGI